MEVLEPTRDRGATLVDLIDRVLDKGVVIDADITVSLAGVELLGIKIRAALASFETAAKYGLEFPSGTNLENKAWKDAQVERETCRNVTSVLKERSCSTWVVPGAGGRAPWPRGGSPRS